MNKCFTLNILIGNQVTTSYYCKRFIINFNLQYSSQDDKKDKKEKEKKPQKMKDFIDDVVKSHNKYRKTHGKVCTLLPLAEHIINVIINAYAFH